MKLKTKNTDFYNSKKLIALNTVLSRYCIRHMYYDQPVKDLAVILGQLKNVENHEYLKKRLSQTIHTR